MIARRDQSGSAEHWDNTGKRHLSWKPEFRPNHSGSDEFFGILSGADDFFTHTLEWLGTGGPCILESCRTR